MIVAIHQPHFLPWLGYLDRMLKADLFILLDHVQFERQNYQNRVRIKSGQGAQWLTVPVCRNGREEAILDTQVDNKRQGRLRWGRKACRTLRYSYQGAPFYKRYGPDLEAMLESRWDSLVELDLRLIEFLREALEIRTPMRRSSELGVEGAKSGLVLGLCRAVGAKIFLGGLGGSRGYLDEAAFKAAGVGVAWQDFRHPRYDQRPKPDQFIEGLSAVDLLFNRGPEAGELLRSDSGALAGGAAA